MFVGVTVIIQTIWVFICLFTIKRSTRSSLDCVAGDIVLVQAGSEDSGLGGTKGSTRKRNVPVFRACDFMPQALLSYLFSIVTAYFYFQTKCIQYFCNTTYRFRSFYSDFLKFLIST